MPLRFRNLDVTPDDPISSWGFEGMLAAIDRGFARDWRKLVHGVLDDPSLHPVLDEALNAAESRSTVALIRAMLDRHERTDEDETLRRLVSEALGTGMDDHELARRRGIPIRRLRSYLSGQAPAPAYVLVGIQRIAEHRRALLWGRTPRQTLPSSPPVT